MIAKKNISINQSLSSFFFAFFFADPFAEIQTCKLNDKENFSKSYLQTAINLGLLSLTIPDKLTSSKQRYYLTELGNQARKI